MKKVQSTKKRVRKPPPPPPKTRLEIATVVMRGLAFVLVVVALAVAVTRRPARITREIGQIDALGDFPAVARWIKATRKSHVGLVLGLDGDSDCGLVTQFNQLAANATAPWPSVHFATFEAADIGYEAMLREMRATKTERIRADSSIFPMVMVVMDGGTAGVINDREPDLVALVRRALIGGLTKH